MCLLTELCVTRGGAKQGEHGLKISGRKNELVERVLTYVAEASEEPDEPDEPDEPAPISSQTHRSRKTSRPGWPSELSCGQRLRLKAQSLQRRSRG
ncbi:unnamed protein product [Effrenium voratum]|nr:unnamed protein product [Effrenium voratum]